MWISEVSRQDQPVVDRRTAPQFEFGQFLGPRTDADTLLGLAAYEDRVDWDAWIAKTTDELTNEQIKSSLYRVSTRLKGVKGDARRLTWTMWQT
jgi:hypothetical protein